MLTRLRVKNFKRFDSIDIELGRSVVFIGPNNSGKTTALQALALWEIGLRRWSEKRKSQTSQPEKRPGVTVNRRDLLAIPVPEANLLWRDLRVRTIDRKRGAASKSIRTSNVRIEIIVDGITNSASWSCGLEFDYANDESLYCRPLRLDEAATRRMLVPSEASALTVAFLPPMSGLADREYQKQPGEIGFLLGQGQTAQVLRNLCYQIYTNPDRKSWKELVNQIHSLFGIELQAPKLIAERSEIEMAYKDERGNMLGLSSSGRGLQQTLLLLAHLYANPNAVLLLDEPDAHLEALRQRQTYNLLIDVARDRGSQIISASHSEVVLDEAVGRDTVIAFVGKPHRLDDHTAQVKKALRDIGYDQYYQAEIRGWVLYVENSTDEAILRSFARLLKHPASQYLESPYVKYVGTNLPSRAREHFYGLRVASVDLVGIAIFDRLDKPLQSTDTLVELSWQKREIENYFCTEKVLLAYADKSYGRSDLFSESERSTRVKAMTEAIAEVTDALKTLGKPAPWSDDLKATDDFLDPLFNKYFEKLELPMTIRKSNYHELVDYVDPADLDAEISDKLDAIVEVAKRAKTRT